MKKHCLALVLGIILGSIALTGCSGTKTSEESSVEASAEQVQEETSSTDAGSDEDTETVDEEGTDALAGDSEDAAEAEANAETDPETTAADGETLDADAIFKELAGYTYDFSSGAGAWATLLHIAEDGSFYGDYHDADAGETGDGYEGVVYLCQFRGKFTAPEKVSDYIYRMQIETISYEKEKGTEEIADGILMKYEDPYGLEDAEDIYIYRKGVPLSELPEEYLGWVTGKGINLDGQETLPFCGIYNESRQEGFSGAVLTDDSAEEN